MAKRKVFTKPTFEEAKRLYVHRYTMEHVPAWASKACENGLFYAPQFETDAAWYVCCEWMHDGTMFCDGQTFPVGQWLDKPFRQGGKEATKGHVEGLLKKRKAKLDSEYREGLNELMKTADKFGVEMLWLEG